MAEFCGCQFTIQSIQTILHKRRAKKDSEIVLRMLLLSLSLSKMGGWFGCEVSYEKRKAGDVHVACLLQFAVGARTAPHPSDHTKARTSVQPYLVVPYAAN